MCAMIIFLTEPNKTLLCMHWICTWSFLQPTDKHMKWILGAIGWNRLHGIYTASPVDVLIFGWHIDV
jgi:hypothetical protein